MKKSEKKKKVEGTARRDRKPIKIEFSDEWPEPRPMIKNNEVAMYFYKVICGHLAKYKLLDDADSFLISQAAFNWATYEEMAEHVAYHGIYHTVGEHGTRQVSPEYTAMKDAIANFDKHQKLLGATPWARNNMKEMFIQPEEKDENKDPFMNVIKGNKKAANG